MQTLIGTAGMKPQDYAVVLPMSSEYPDTSFYYFKEDYDPVCKNAIVCFNFTKETANNKSWLDSLQHARLIFITGGDQLRIMTLFSIHQYTRPYIPHSKMEQPSGHQCRCCCYEQVYDHRQPINRYKLFRHISGCSR